MPKIHRRTRQTKYEMAKARSSIVLVADNIRIGIPVLKGKVYSPSTNNRCWWCFLTGQRQYSQVSFSSQQVRRGLTSWIFCTFGSLKSATFGWAVLTATLPVGYSPPIPIPTTTQSAPHVPDLPGSAHESRWTYRNAKRYRVSVPVPTRYFEMVQNSHQSIDGTLCPRTFGSSRQRRKDKDNGGTEQHPELALSAPVPPLWPPQPGSWVWMPDSLNSPFFRSYH